MLSYLGSVNWLAVLVCAVLSMALGFIWYGPLFGKPWGKMTGWTSEKTAAIAKNSMAVSYILAFMTAIIVASVLAVTLLAVKASGIGDGITAAIVLWLGFTGATTGVNMIFERRPLELFCIVAGYHLVALVIYSIVLSIW